ncbi:MAG: DUF3788 family protein, partial [Cellulomonas sp.]|nr:DUF3788 family protein [Cellulomonas sp.]
LGPAAEAWHALRGVLAEAGTTVGWHHYRDGGWLAKATKGSKTVAWLQVGSGFAQMTCYFAERHRPALATADLPPTLRAQIVGQAMVGRMLPFSLQVRTLDDVRSAATVLTLKQTLK